MEEAWTDINIVMGGGWPPSEMDAMPLAELLRWHAIALARNQHDIAAMQG